MKRFLFLTVLVAIFTTGHAQEEGYYLIETPFAGVNPGNLNTDPEEPYGAGLPADWTIIHNGLANSPEWTPIQNIPFVFYFNGEPTFQYKVSTSGTVTFSTGAPTAPDYVPKVMPNAEMPDKSVFVWGLKGNNIQNKVLTKVFGEDGSRQLWISFNAYNYYPGNPICTMFWSIVLEEGTNNIYIVDQRKSFICIPKLAVGLKVAANEYIEIAGSPLLGGMAGNDPTALDNSFYQFIPGEQPKRDIETLNIDVDNLTQLSDAPIIVQGDFASYGTETLKSFDYNYQIDNGPVQSIHFSGPVNLSNLEHSIPWVPSQAGEYQLKVWLGLPNGLADQRPSNDTLTMMVTVLDEIPVRQILVEEATQHNCPPCASLNPAFDATIQANFAEVAAVKYASHWPGANNDWRRLFNQPHHGAMVSYWEVSGVPTAIVDGAFYKGSPSGFNAGTIASRSGQPGFFDLDFTEAVNGNNIDISVSVTNLVDMPGKNVFMRIAIVQDEKIFPTATGTNGEKEFYDIMRYMVPDPNGTTLSTAAGASQTVNFTYPIDPGFLESPIRVVAWVMDADSKEVYMTDKSTGIYLCAGGGNMTGTITASDASCVGNDGSLAVFPSGGTGAYTYSWSNGATTPTLNSVGPGNYTVTVSDGGDCSMKFYAKVGQDAPAKVNLNPRQETCVGATDGEIEVYVTGGTAPYTFAWNNGATNQNLNALAPGNYSVTVTDANGCITPQVGVNVKAATAGTVYTPTSTPDNGTNNGTVSADATGGTHPYTFSWDNGMTGQDLEGLAAGIYTVTVTDYYGCPMGSQTVTVDSNVGLDDQLADAGIATLETYPNPTTGIVRLEIVLNQMEDLAIHVYDVNGRTIYQEDMYTTTYSSDLDLTDLPSGVYTLQLSTAQGSATTRLIRR